MSIVTHHIPLYMNCNTVTYFDGFGVKQIPKEIKRFIGNKNVITNIYRIQAYDLAIISSFCITVIEYVKRQNQSTPF